MKTFPPVELYSQIQHAKIAFGLGFIMCVAILHVPCLHAQNLKVRTQTVAKATQFMRTDQTVAAQRPLSQTVDMWGYDLTGQKNGALRGEISFRYFNDFALSERQRANPYLAHDWNRLTIDLANVSWRPMPMFDLSVGRMVTRSMFAARDFDGGRLHVNVPLQRGVFFNAHTYVGQHVVGRPDTFNPDSYDVQGRPIEDRVDEIFDPELLTGFRSGMTLPVGAINVGWERRETDDHLLEEKLGVGANGNVRPSVNVVGYMSYHTLLQDLDRARLNLAWTIFRGGAASWEPEPRPTSLVTGFGVEHIVPTFDSSSIFNLFGTSPSQSVFWSTDYRLGHSSIGFRTWLKLYQGDGENFDLASEDVDSRTVGAAIEHTTRFRLAEKPLDVSSMLSIQPAGTHGYGADQGIARTSFRLPLFNRRIIARARTALVLAGPDPSTRREGGVALTQLLGFDADASFGRFGLAAVGQTSDVLGTHLNVYASFSSELWP